jgi:hypothetical protein
VIKACAVADGSRCIEKRQASCLASIPAGTTYEANQAEACVDAVSTAYRDAKLTAEENRSTQTICNRVFDGAGNVNATCMRDFDCKLSLGLRCVFGGLAGAGTCQMPERIQGGGSCAAPNQMCVEGFHCGVTLHCDINSQLGEPCNVILLPCAPSAQCNEAGMCVAKFKDGDLCTSDEQCAHELCARGSGVSQGLCAQQLTLAPNEPFCIDAR